MAGSDAPRHPRDFDRLTHLGRGRRLRPLARELLRQRFGIRAVALRQVAESINIVYRGETRRKRRFVLRLTPPAHFHGRRDVSSEMEWLRFLGSEGIGVPEPLPALDGSTVVSTSWAEIPGEWHCVVFDWIRGRDLATRWTTPNIERYGRLAARLHVGGSRFEPTPGFRIRTATTVFPHCDPEFEDPEPLVLFDRVPEGLLPGERKEFFRRVHELAQSAITRLFETRGPLPIHNDLHPWNVMVSRGRIYAIDFENMLMGHPVQDVGTTLNYFRDYVPDDAPYEERVAAFRRGYESEAAWPEEYPGQIRAMTASHRLMLCNFYASHRDPEYREFAFKFFGRCEKRLREDLPDIAHG